MDPPTTENQVPTRICGRAAALAVAIAAMAACLPASAQAQEGYADYDALTNELRSLADGSGAVDIRSLGQSREGRDIWLLEIGSAGGAPHGERPALLVVANLEANHLVGSALATEIARYLSANGSDPDVQRVLDEQVVYIVPRLNPDGAEAMFADVAADRRTNTRAHDADNDGRMDEDGPSDLNGDGLITLMRVPDPSGAYTLDPDDERLMKIADPARGESGGYTLHWEGADDDGDGFINEDAPGGVDLNRNFQHRYPYWEPDAGPHMVSEPETRALMDFMVERGNVGAILTFGLSDNLVTPPNGAGELAGARLPDLATFADASNDGVLELGVFGNVASSSENAPRLRGVQRGRDNDPQSGQRPATAVNGDDVEYHGKVSEAYRDLTGVEQVPFHREPEGAFFQIGYFHYGVPSFSTIGWGVAEPEDPGTGDASILGSLEGAGVDAFVDWSEHEHPDLGTVEIGGFRTGAAINPAAEVVTELGPAHGEFAVALAGMLPRVRVVDTEVTAHGGGTYTVQATVDNTGYFPTAMQQGLVARAVDPVTVLIDVPAEDVISGDPKTGRINQLEGSGRREGLLWVVRGEPGQTIEIRSRAQKGGRDAVTVTLP